MQRNVALIVDLRRNVQGNSRKERLIVERRRGTQNICGSGGICLRCNAGDKRLLGAHLDNGLLAVQRGDTGAGQHMHLPLGLQEIDHGGKILELQGEPQSCRERAPGITQDAGSQQTAKRRRRKRGGGGGVGSGTAGVLGGLNRADAADDAAAATQFCYAIGIGAD